MKVHVVESSLKTKAVSTRIPFKFGVYVLRTVPIAELTLTVEAEDGSTEIGRSSDLLIPKWFDKSPDTSPEEDSAALARSAEQAAAKYIEAGSQSAFDLWKDVYDEQVGARDHRDADVLVRGFGVALAERALIDATCRLAGLSFYQALCSGALGFEAERVIPETRGWSPERLAQPLMSIAVRHTVGMLDPLTISEIPPDERIDDGLPQALEQDIETYGLRWFKVKVTGDPMIDRERLRNVARVVFATTDRDVKFTLDGNEGCTDLEAFAGTLEDLAKDETCGRLIKNTVLIEQPLPRRDTFDAAANRSLERLSRIAPVIIDEADTDALAFQRAIEIGYKGVSVKACKGVFRAVANRALIDTRGDGKLFQSGEDLTNLGSVPLQQDLALQATLGIQNVERNGHHYFRGLDHLDDAVCAKLVESLPGLYTERDRLTQLWIEHGSLDLAGIADGLGLGGELGPLFMEKPN
ncbi:MAG: hypothetical protein IH944_01895 [Armatimonadetes bacterium]|nr:hypothetical protein [Armatimonadota bacterium]